MGAAGAKRALLIGSPVQGLQGIENDLNMMTDVLKSHGFEVDDHAHVKKLFHEDATRENIIEAWESLIFNASQNDTVVIYYSGHGVCVESNYKTERPGFPSRIQFIVPYDFDSSLSTWKGISDGELSLLLRRTTQKTKNVTYILDCCHSAGTGRKFLIDSFKLKTFDLIKSSRMSGKETNSRYGDLVDVLEPLRQAKRLVEDPLEHNPHAVRIAAAAANETAWEYRVKGHEMGLLTKNLAKAIMNPSHHRSWRDIMLEVSMLVEQDYPEGNQHPRSAGPDSRTPFSLMTTATGAHLATIWKDEYATMAVGRVNGVQMGDTYTITPFGSHGRCGDEITTATVTAVNGFAAMLGPTPRPSQYGSSETYIMGLAVLDKKQHRWPVKASEAPQEIYQQLDRSPFFRRCKEDESPFARFQREGDQIFLYNERGSVLDSERLNNGIIQENGLRKLLKKAREYGQAQHMFSLRSGSEEESFGADVEIEVGLGRKGRKQVLTRRSESFHNAMVENAHIKIDENDEIYISVRNKSTMDVYINVLCLDATGKTTLISGAWERGIGLAPGRSSTLAEKAFPLRGMPVRWPEPVPKNGIIEERLVFVITNREVDLRDLDTSIKPYVRRGIPKGGIARESGVIPYDVEHVRYQLRPSPPSLKA